MGRKSCSRHVSSEDRLLCKETWRNLEVLVLRFQISLALPNGQMDDRTGFSGLLGMRADEFNFLSDSHWLFLIAELATRHGRFHTMPRKPEQSPWDCPAIGHLAGGGSRQATRAEIFICKFSIITSLHTLILSILNTALCLDHTVSTPCT